ncbi:MAG: hypothetical protein J6W28_02975, partial [Clostridia bacterium]|nr:hypothetical protein [Clostridia bacterium]
IMIVPLVMEPIVMKVLSEIPIYESGNLLGISSIEDLASYFTSSFAFGGTSLLIVVGVALETVRDLEAQLSMRNYKGFLK